MAHGRKVLGLGAAAALAAVVVCKIERSHATTIGTFNIERFPHDDSDPEAVGRRIAELDADILAVQEIRDVAVLRQVLARVSEETGRDLQLFTTDCGGNGGWFTPGVVWDANRWTVKATRAYPRLEGEGDACVRSEQGGALVVLQDEHGHRIAPLAIHFKSGPNGYGTRQDQWRRALALAARVEAEHEADVVLMGDVNSTGFTTAPPEEPAFVRGIVAEAGRKLLSGEVPCTEYWSPPDVAGYTPSLLDHIVVKGGTWSEPEVMGMCRDLSCAVVEDPGEMHADFSRVSDHCPLRTTLTW